jgi:hypothetical protein
MTEAVRSALGVADVGNWLGTIRTEIAPALPEEVRITLEVEGEGGGTWTLHRTPGGLEIDPGRHPWADSVLACDLPRFLALVTRRLDGRRAFFDGTVRVEGDVGLLLRLQRALPTAA